MTRAERGSTSTERATARDERGDTSDRAAPILRAVHQGQHGHPVIFARAVFPELRTADPAVGARQVLRRDPARVCEVAVDDAGVLRDVDEPDDYRRLVDQRD